jgi:hypothetical protein
MTPFRTLAVVVSIAMAGWVGAAPARASVQPQQVVAAFRHAHLSVGKSWRMQRSDYGLAPYVARGVRFIVPTLGEDRGGRVFTGTLSDLRRLKRYYDSFGKTSAVLFSWTYLNTARRVLLQMNGDMSSTRWRRYRRVAAAI